MVELLHGVLEEGFVGQEGKDSVDCCEEASGGREGGDEVFDICAHA